MTSRTLNSAAPREHGWLLLTFLLSAALVVCIVSRVWGTPPGVPPASSWSERAAQDTRPRITYGGRIYLSFPNYDVVLGGAPRNIHDLSSATGSGDSRVVFKDRRHMRWDGQGFFLHPAYPQELVSRYRFANRIVGQPGEQWPPVVRAEPLVRIPPLLAAAKVTYPPRSVIPADALAVPRADAVSHFVERPWVVEQPSAMPPPAMVPRPDSAHPSSSYGNPPGDSTAPWNSTLQNTRPTTQITAHRARHLATFGHVTPATAARRNSHFDCQYATWYPGGTIACEAVWSGSR